MELINSASSLAVKARCDLHRLVFDYVTKRKVSGNNRKLKKKVVDASRKFFIESLNGNKSLRLKKSPSLRVHDNIQEVYICIQMYHTFSSTSGLIWNQK